MNRFTAVSRSLLCLPFFLSLGILRATVPPLVCPGGTALGRMELTVVPPAGGAARNLETVNRILAGDTINYKPGEIDAPDKKKVRIALLLVPSDGSKIVVLDPQPADKATSWTVPFRAQLASLVWGPVGLDKAKVASLLAKDSQLIGQLADYAAKTEEAQALIQAITQQQALDTGESVDAAVASFASQFPSAKLDRTQPLNVQLGTLLHSVNPTLSTYDPLAQNPQQVAAQSAGLAAAVGGLFFGGSGSLAVTGGAVLINLHSLLFPHTQFLSALAQSAPDSATSGDTTAAPAPPADSAAAPSSLALCGSKPPAIAHTESAYLWAIRIPDAAAPALGLKSAVHLPIGIKSSVPLTVKPNDWKLVARIQDWKLISDGGSPDEVATVPVTAKVNTTAKTLDLDLTSSKLKAGTWRLAGSWDWDPVMVTGNMILHDFPKFTSAHLTPASQDKLTAGAGTLDLDLTGDDFEFVHKIEYKKQGDPFAQAEELPFHLPKEPPAGPESSLKVRLDAKSLSTGNYVFLIAQTDGKVHEAPFKVLPAPPSVTGTPIVLNTGAGPQTVVLHGSGLDRVEQITADGAQFTLGDPGSGDERTVTVTLASGAKTGSSLSLALKVANFEEPVTIDDAFRIAGPKPAIASVRESSQGNVGIALNPGEMAARSLMSYEIGLATPVTVTEVDLSCDNLPDAPGLKVKAGEAKDDLKLTQESPDTLFLAFRPKNVGPSGCAVAATLVTAKSGQSDKRKLGAVVMLPQIDSFEVTEEKAGGSAYFATLEGHDLEGITKVGWDAQTGTPVDSIPTAVPGPGNKERLRVAVPWPAPSPHAPLYIWMRGEEHGRLSSAKY